MRQILAITRKEFLLWAQKPGSWVLVFIVPFLFIWIVQSVFGSTGTPVVTVFAVNEDAGPGGAQALLSLQQGANLKVEELETRDEADRRVGAGERMAAVIIPAGFTDAAKTPAGSRIDIIIDPARSEQAHIVIGLVNSALAPMIVDAEVTRGVEASVEQVMQNVSQALVTATPLPETTGEATPTQPSVQTGSTVVLGSSVQVTFTPTPTPGTLTTVTNTPTPGAQTTQTTPNAQVTNTAAPTALFTPTEQVFLTPQATATLPGAVQPGIFGESGTGFTDGSALAVQRFLIAALKGVISSQVQDAIDNPKIQVETQQAGGAARKPSLLDYLVPGYALMFVFFLISNLAVTVVEERQTGTLSRLLVAPVSRNQILLGKGLTYFIIAVVQFVIVLLVSKLAFGLDLGGGVSGSTMALGLIIFASAAAMVGLGILVAAFARTEGQADGLAIVLVLAMAVVSGAMFPSISLPVVKMITPHYWAIQGFLNVIARGQGLDGALGPAGILIIMASIFFTIGAVRFRFE